MSSARETDGEVRITLHTDGLSAAGALAFVGVLCVVVGVVAATRLVEELENPLPWLLGGEAFLMIAAGLWWWRLQVVISEQGVSFLPLTLHQQYCFLWSDVRGWRWHRYSYPVSEGGVAEETELILVFAGGRETVLPEPYCREEISCELERRIGAESRRVAQAPLQELLLSREPCRLA